MMADEIIGVKFTRLQLAALLTLLERADLPSYPTELRFELPGARTHAAGLTAACQEPGCRSVWYSPRHEPGTGLGARGGSSVAITGRWPTGPCVILGPGKGKCRGKVLPYLGQAKPAGSRGLRPPHSDGVPLTGREFAVDKVLVPGY
jgi:hypothetical protein